MSLWNRGPLAHELPDFREAAEKLHTETIGATPGNDTRRFLVNKTTHRVRFENETESEVTIVVESKE